MIGLLALTILFFGVAYWMSPERPSPENPRGWWAWYDQGEYYRSVQAFEHDDFSPNEHSYPIGYALIGSWFYPVMPQHPFFIPDLIFTCCICCFFYKSCEQIVTPYEALIVTVLAFFIPVTIRVSLIRPWTNTPTTACLLALAYLALIERRDRSSALVAGVCTSVIAATRPGDLLYCWPLIGAIWLGCRDWREARQRAFGFAVGALPFTLVFAFCSFAIHGSLVSTYYRWTSTNIGFGIRSFPIKLYTFFIDGYALFGQTQTIIKAFPMVLLALPGIWIFVKTFRSRGLCVVAALAGAAVYFLAYNDFWVSNAFQFGGIRYWVFVIAFLFLCAYLSLRLGVRHLGWWTTGLLLALPVVAWTLPQMGARPVSVELAGRADADSGWECKANADGSCMISIDFVKPAQFNVLRLVGIPAIRLLYAPIWIDSEESPMFRDHFLGDSPDGTVNVIFYGNKRGRSIRIVIPAPDSRGHLVLTEFDVVSRRFGMALKSPFKRFHPIAWVKGGLTSFSEEITSPLQKLNLKSGESCIVNFSVKNTGTQPWMWGMRMGGVDVGSRWLDMQGARLPISGARARLRRSVIRPGERGNVPMTIIAPDHPGSYLLSICMVQEGVSWFDDAAAKPLILHVDVQ